jgi:hypothetical protein
MLRRNTNTVNHINKENNLHTYIRTFIHTYIHTIFVLPSVQEIKREIDNLTIGIPK